MSGSCTNCLVFTLSLIHILFFQTVQLGDVGQGTELDGLEEKAKATGASQLYVLDLKKDFVENYIFPTQLCIRDSLAGAQHGGVMGVEEGLQLCVLAVQCTGVLLSLIHILKA